MSITCHRERFELIDSVEHLSTKYPVSIKYMKLSVEVNFDDVKINCVEDLELVCVDDLEEPKIELDCADLNIIKVTYYDFHNLFLSNLQLHSKQEVNELGFLSSNEKLIIQLPDTLKKGISFSVKIEYSAIPRKGFHFVSSTDSIDNTLSKQAWTQGEMIESKFWFPCIDDPKIKYPRQVSVTTPNEFVVVANGEPSDVIDTDNNKKIHIWKEDHPNPAYLTSIVIGKFFESQEPYQNEINKNEIRLLYYVPEGKKDRVKRTFGSTLDAMKFFESYFGFPYPYSRYAQTIVKEFEYGGMENTTCTTLEEEILLDKKAANDDIYISAINSSRSIIAHELAHQWFGDLVTCIDWSNTWLNEGFATYCEALYTEHTDSNRKEEFHRYMEILASVYFAESCNEYERSIVTNVYKYPDELFDRHSYKKGAWVLHMIRHIIGDNNFRKALRKYLSIYQYKNANTEDFRKVLEEVSGINLESFFNQWIYTKGHPELEVVFNKYTKSIKIVQKQNDVFFDFEIEIKIALSDGSVKTYPFHVIKQRENTFEITKMDTNAIQKNVEWFSIDPELKILKEMASSYDSQQLSMVICLIRNGQTFAERSQGLRAITKNIISNENCEEIINLLNDVVLHDDYYGVSAAAASKLGAIGALVHIDKEIKDKAFQTIVECLNESRDSKKIGITLIKRNLISAIGNYIPENDFYVELERIIQNGDDSYYVEAAAISTIASYKDNRAFERLKKVVDKADTFNDIIPIAVISALSRFSNIDDEDLKKQVISILIRKTGNGNYNRIRGAATSTLGEFLLAKNKKTVNKDVFTTLIQSLNDKHQQVRTNACAVFETAFSPDEHEIGKHYVNQLLLKLEQMTNNDVFYEVRRKAELCLFAIRARHYSKMKRIMKSEGEFNDYLAAKKQIRMKHVFGRATLQ